jgi:rod shape-determining protein MreC
VLLLTDKDSGVGAMLADSRIQKPVGGTGEPFLIMKYISIDDEVNSGERVVTSGMDRIFPRDLPVGTIADVKAGLPFKLIRVRPAANLERLEEVFVLLTLKPLEMKQNSAVPNSGTAPANAPSAAVTTPAAPEKP